MKRMKLKLYLISLFLLSGNWGYTQNSVPRFNASGSWKPGLTNTWDDNITHSRKNLQIPYNVPNLPERVKQTGTVREQNDYYPYGGRHTSGNTYALLPGNNHKFNGKEEQTSGYLDYGARMYDNAMARWGTPDPLAEKYKSMSPYNYCLNNPVMFVDPDGRDAIYIVFPEYKISTPIGKLRNLGHAGILLIDNKTGLTKYYEYGRYDKEEKGEVRNRMIADVKLGDDGNPTKESLNKVLGQISKLAGQGGKIAGAYIKSNKFKEMMDYAEAKKKENSNPNRKPYSIMNNNCGTFATDVIEQDTDIKKKLPSIIDPRPNSMVKEYQQKFKSITYDPEKDKKIKR